MRTILHSDLNYFYAAVECLYQPSYRDKPLSVAGSTEERHGIILTSNPIAKKCGVKTGEAIWQAKQKCPELITVTPNYSLYLRFSKMVREIYTEYTNQIEPFGIDEAWLDVTGSQDLYGSGLKIATEINQRVKRELGLTVSIGVSWNKIFAKLGSDYKKPDGITVFDTNNYRDSAWRLPVEDLLYVGRATKKKLNDRCIRTIGDLANTDVRLLRSALGKMGVVLHTFANGRDMSPVAHMGEKTMVKSVGNSFTAPRDLVSLEDAKPLMFALAESVSMRLREQGLAARTIVVSIRTSELNHFERQAKLERFTDITEEIIQASIELMRKVYQWNRPMRSLGIRVTDLVPNRQPVQLQFGFDEEKRERLEKLDQTVDQLKVRFGNLCIRRATMLVDAPVSELDAKKNHVIHPVGYF